MKTTRIKALIRAKGILSETLDRNETRVRRAVDNVIDYASDAVLESMAQAEEILSKLASTNLKSGENIAEILNDYAHKMLEANEWGEMADIFAELRSKLNEEVEVEDVKIKDIDE